MAAPRKRPRIALIDLGIDSSSFNLPNCTFQGYVSSTSFSFDVFKITLVSVRPNHSMVYVEVKGENGIQLSDRVKETDRIRLLCKGGIVEKLENGVLPRARVTYENGIEGWILSENKEKEEHFSLGLLSPPEAIAVKSMISVPRPANLAQASAQPLQSSTPSHTTSITLTSASTPLAALDLNSPTSSAKKRKLAKATNDDERDPSPSPVSKPPSSKRVAIEVSSLPASTAPAPFVKKDKIEAQVILSKMALTQAPRPPPVLNTLNSLRVPSTSTSNAKIQNSNSVESEWHLVSPSGRAYRTLQKVKDKGITGSSHFAVMVVKFDKLSPPRVHIQNDSYCARFLVTDPSLDSNNLDSWASIVELQWYERNPKKLTPFKPGDILFLRDVSITKLSKLRRYDRTPHPPYLSIPSSSLLSSSILPDPQSLVFKDTLQLKLSQPELDHAVKLAKFYRGKMLDVGKEGEPIDYQLKRLDGQTKPKELEFASGR